MPNFAYIVKDAKGARVEGILKADTLDMAVDKLAKEGSTIISVKAAAEGAFAKRCDIAGNRQIGQSPAGAETVRDDVHNGCRDFVCAGLAAGVGQQTGSG